MDKESNSAGGFPSSGIIAIVMLTAGILFIREPPLETTRLPVNEPRIQQSLPIQDVDARLWQDPFSAVARARDEPKKRNPDQSRTDDPSHSLGTLKADMEARKKRSGGKVVVLGVMVEGGPYSDNIESRRRIRYAVLAGLNASRLAPIDGEHLGYFFPTDVKNAEGGSPSTEIVPYEWFEPAPEGRSSKREIDKDLPLVLVMWLDDDMFRDEPLCKMRKLANQFTEATSWRVIGPSRSDDLRNMVNEVGNSTCEPLATKASPPVRYYSAAATTPDDHINPKLPPGVTLSDFLAEKDVDLVRTIGDDSKLADALIAELELRGLHSGNRAVGDTACETKSGGPHALSHIGIISEWDTLYGRTLRREFRAGPDDKGFCVHASGYVRGLDGHLPAVGGADASTAKPGSGKPGADGKDDNRRRDGTYVEIAEGQSQFDYLRRLALSMTEIDRELRENSPDGMGLRAIGVLGSDVHDKLLVLRALQPEFPNAIFFTTDLDARFLHPREKAWTRNLIVGSHFGLRLSDHMQPGVVRPPFRDSYQTSSFLATRLAIDDARRAPKERTGALERSASLPTSQKTIARWFDQPRLFEIGRTQAFDFSPAPRAAPLPAPAPIPLPAAAISPVANTPPAVGRVWRRGCEGPDWIGCDNIHPKPSPLYPHLRIGTLLFIASLLILSLWLPLVLISRASRKWLDRVLFVGGSLRQRTWRWAGLAALLVLVHVVLPLFLAFHWEPFAAWLTSNGKPLVGLEGISIWPTEALRLITLVLCLYLIFAGWTALSRNLDTIIDRFQLECTRKNLEKNQHIAERNLSRWVRIINMFSLRFIIPPSDQANATGLPAGTVDFWRRYIVQNRISARATRTAACVVLAMAGSWFLWLAVHDSWSVPRRGPVSLAVHRGTTVLMFVAIYFLVFFVVDATAFCVTFVRGLRRDRPNWPDTTQIKFESELNIYRTYLNNWINLEFIAMRTKCVNRLIYFPFIVLSLFLVSRSAAFDDWYMPATGIILAVLGASVALACAVALRYAAETSRRYAIERMRDALIRVSGEEARMVPASAFERPKPAQLTLLLQRMEQLHEGAFAPFWQQPLLKAVLLPFATYGGTTLLDYMALMNV